MTRTERDQAICDLYQDGATQEALGEQFSLSKTRVGQILKKANILTRLPERQTNPSAFVGIHMPPNVKTSLVELKKRDGAKSLSSLVTKIIIEELERQRIQIEPEIDRRNVELPFAEAQE